MSMTGYGEAAAAIGNYQWRCVVQSVNSRNLDIRFRFPAALSVLEIRLRKEAQKFVRRGKVDVSFSYALSGGDGDEILSAYFNPEWVAGFCRAGEELLDSLDWQANAALRASILKSAFSQREAFADTELKIDCAADKLILLFDAALKKHAESRKLEGEELGLDLINRLTLLDDFIAAISEKAQSMPEIFRERIKHRIEVLIADKQFDLDHSRLAQEVAHLIDKADISEEIVRFKAHIVQFRAEINESSTERKGKKLEFIVQEMLREVNTVGSKANLLEITRSVVEVKNELEKIREQVQNIV